MSTYTQIIYQIVFSTKYREPTMVKLGRDELYKYMWGVLNHQHCHAYRIGGVADHLHIVTHLHPSISLASLVKDIKLATTSFIKQRGIFSSFRGWQDGYSAFTYSFADKDSLVDYVKNQEEHHCRKSFLDELKELLREQGVDYDPAYWS